LRDIIYSYATDDKPLKRLTASSDAQDSEMQPHNVARLELLLLSRKFSYEYQYAVNKLAVLEIFDLTRHIPWHKDILELPRSVSAITSLALHLFCDDQSEGDDDDEEYVMLEGMSSMDCHLVWVVELLRRLPLIRTLSVKAHACLSVEDGVESHGLDKLKIDLTPWLNISVLQDIELYHTEIDPPNSAEDYEHLMTRELLGARWTAKSREWEGFDRDPDDGARVIEAVNTSIAQKNDSTKAANKTVEREEVVPDPEDELMRYMEKLRLIVKNQGRPEHEDWPSDEYWASVQKRSKYGAWPGDDHCGPFGSRPKLIPKTRRTLRAD
jgi:hypothetical protein